MASNFSVGFATFDQGTPPFPETIRNQFTIQSLLTHHPLIEEILVVNNNPNVQTPLAEFCKKCGPRVRHIPFPSPQGTSAPRNEVFRQSKSEYTACIDGHVILGTGFFGWLNEFYAQHGKNCKDLLHGTMVNESGGIHATHMNDQWRGEMWGTWGICWQSQDGFRMSCLNPSDNKIVFVTMDDNAQRSLTENEILARNLDDIRGWSGHETILKSKGWDQPTEPFVVPGHGMGFFACRTDSWLPFHADARGFGGEEMTTTVRYRQAFRRCWTVPQAKWWHDFGRWYAHQEHGAAAAPPYRLSLWDKVRNYVLEFKRLGMDINIIRGQFPPSRFPEDQWQQLLQGMAWPIAPGEAPVPEDLRNFRSEEKISVSSESPIPASVVPMSFEPDILFDPSPFTIPPLTVDDHFLQACSDKTDIADDLPWLRKYAARCGSLDDVGHVTEVVTSEDQMSSLAFFAAGVKSLVRVCSSSSDVTNWMRPNTFYQHIAMIEQFRPETVDRMVEPCDLLYLDIAPYTAVAVWDALTKYAEKSRRYIIVRGSTKYAETTRIDDKVTPLVVPAVRTYLTKNPHWTSIANHPTPYGLIVLSRDDRDKKQLPSLIRKSLNFGRALAQHTVNGFIPTDEAIRDARLDVCVICPERFHDYCAKCGCNVTKKANWSQEKCPLNKWPGEMS